MANHNRPLSKPSADYLQLRAKFATDEYTVYLAEGLLTNSTLLQEQVLNRRACVITNPTIAELYLPILQDSLSHVQMDIITIPDGEAYKNLNTLDSIYEHLITNKHDRDTTIFALGGGVIGDIAGFAAATYKRGMRLVHVPTSLLAQVDSAIGGKTAINHPLAKNMIGSFYNPHAVIIDIATLRTLPKRELKAGCAEIIKYALLVGGEFLDNLAKLFALDFAKDDLSIATAIIAKSCGVKIDIVKRDEKEQAGIRELLNLGHTFAHAIETVTHYKRFLHGEAVAIGLNLAALLSHQLNYISAQQAEFVTNLLHQAGLPWQLPDDISPELLKTAMLRDKKVRNGKLPFVIIKSFGNCALDYSINLEQLDMTDLMKNFELKTN